MTRKQTVGHFMHKVTGRVEYLTPKWVLEPLGEFDLDPCASFPRPFDIAKTNYTEGGLEKPWSGFVWLNPPYGITNRMNEFIDKLANHKGGGICLLNSNTQTRIWQDVIFTNASSFFFIDGRIHFLYPDGTQSKDLFGSPVLIGFGDKAKRILKHIPYRGHYLENHHG